MSLQALSPDDGHSQEVLTANAILFHRRQEAKARGGAGGCHISAVNGDLGSQPVRSGPWNPLGSATPGCTEPAHSPLRQEVLAEH